MMTKQKVGSVLVVGGGVAGVQAALDVAASGFKVYLIDQSPSIGGVMAQLDKTFPTNDCSMCILAPKLVEAGRHPNIILITNAQVTGLIGEPGNFTVKLLRRSRYINEEKCNGCGLCAQKCLVEAIDTYNKGLSDRSAIYIEFPQAVPLKYIIDREKCLGCGICQQICKAGAIEYEQEEKEVELNVGSIIIAPGFEPFDARLKTEYGYGRFPNVVTSIEFERILNASGPYGGLILRPSDGEVPKKIAFIQCVGSRDAQLKNNYCSAACCMYSIKEAIIAREHVPIELNSTIFYMDIRAFGKEFDEYYKRAIEECNVRFVRSRVARITEDPATNNLFVHYVEDEEPKSEEFDMVVLSIGMRPPENVEKLAEVLGIELNNYGFCQTKDFSPIETSKPGVFVCGAFSAPKDIPESVAEASAAAAKAISLLSSERGKLVVVKEKLPERDVSREEPRIGVFICHCGINIGGIVNVPEVVKYAKTLPNVVYVEENLYTCSQDTQIKMREKIEELNLNRVVVAACTPRTHEPLFRATCQEAGLNPYLFEMANIRDQCSWVHMRDPEKATEKAKDLVEAIVAKARLLKPLKKPLTNVIPVGLVIGGGISGMTAALELARQGFDVHLIEREKELGGHLRHIYYTLEGKNPQETLDSLIKNIFENEKIHVHLNAEIVKIDGYVGNFKTTILSNGDEEQIEHGVIIVATGATEYKPTEYFYGKDPRILTQHELEEKLAKGQFKAKTVVMIQCVGARNENRPNCSRICCSQAIKNALKIKEVNPETEVYVLYKDIRTYGFKEDYYREAAAKGVLFLRYDEEHEPKTIVEDGKLIVSAWEPILKSWVPIEADLLILSVAVIPNPDNERLAKMLKVPLTKERFFLEAHMKLRPLDFATDGIFLCGMAHWPKFIDESVAQACGAAARAAIILSNKLLEAEGTVSHVDENLCVGCGLCISICPYNAIEKDENGIAKVNEVLCKGCGTCAASCPKRAITMHQFTDEQLIIQGLAILRRTVHG
ncbi:MAG: CoB--CoM heterodisulfide reductase iron-sulfur subunit A family protein [Candidatus Bathyarchaeota archaeon]|jgi:heterodisulfide reductase subunit A|nr:CoB--CoM heterodisulfide reductase iron-sulfur subunit A family protein [Candidatus Bathyarchaeota archaeon]